MKDFIKFLKSTFIYLLGNVLIKLISFFMLPIYTKYIDPSAYGTYDLHIAYITFLSSILFLDIWGGVMRFMFDYKDEKDKAKPIFNGFAIFSVSVLVYTIILILFNFRMNVEYVGVLYLYGILMNLQNMFGYIARGYSKNFLYALSGIIGSFVTIVCNILFLVYFKMGYEALYISSCIGFLANILTVYFGVRSYKFINFKYYDKSLFKNMYKYSLPLCLNSVAYWFLTSYNKVVINNNLTSYDNGLYAISGKFGLAVNLFTSCFQMAWQELSFSKVDVKKENLGKFYTEGINEYIKFLAIGLLMMLPVINVFFPYIVDESYYDAINIIPFYLLATLASSISSFLASIFSALKKTKSIFRTTAVGSIVNVIFIHLSINKFGVQAASISLFLGYTVNVVRRIFILKKYIDLRVNYRFLILYCIPFALVYLVYTKLSGIYNIIVEFIIIAFAVYIYREKLMYFLNSFLEKLGKRKGTLQ